MSKEVVFKKLDQMRTLLGELGALLEKSFEEFRRDSTTVRAAERNFQLLVDLASDINTQLLIEAGREVPDTYKESFLSLQNLGLLDAPLAAQLARSAMLRNILVHEYDFDEDYAKFYQSAQAFLPSYRAYIERIYASVSENPSQD